MLKSNLPIARMNFLCLLCYQQNGANEFHPKGAKNKVERILKKDLEFIKTLFYFVDTMKR